MNIWRQSSKHVMTIHESSFRHVVSVLWNTSRPHPCQRNEKTECPRAKRFATSPPIIEFSTLCAPGFLRPFEKEKPFCYRRGCKEEKVLEKREIWHSERSTQEMAAYNSMHAQLSCCICACVSTFTCPSEQLFVCMSLGLSSTAVQRGHQLAVGFVFLRRVRLFAYC